MRTIIMFCGYIGSGKDNAANFFIENHNFVNVKMSGDYSREGSLKRVVWDMFGLDPSKVEDRDFRESPNENLGGQTPRKALQFFGHLTRTFLPETWVNNTVRHIKSLPSNANIVITDIRYPNEFEAIKKMGDEFNSVFMVAIDKPNLDLSKPIYNDPSEQSIPALQNLAHYRILNDSTLDVFIDRIHTLSELIFDSPGECRLSD